LKPFLGTRSGGQSREAIPSHRIREDAVLRQHRIKARANGSNLIFDVMDMSYHALYMHMTACDPNVMAAAQARRLCF
jgi:hypothetical protein